MGRSSSLIGPNGAGKSTLLQTLAALVKPSRGEVLFRGRKIGAEIPLLAYRRRLAMVLQEPLLFDTTVYNNVASGLKTPGDEEESQVEPIVGRCPGAFRHRPPEGPLRTDPLRRGGPEGQHRPGLCHGTRGPAPG